MCRLVHELIQKHGSDTLRLLRLQSNKGKVRLPSCSGFSLMAVRAACRSFCESFVRILAMVVYTSNLLVP